MKLAFVDCETTGLEVTQHQVWEVGLILRDTELSESDSEYHWFLGRIDIAKADHVALEIGRFYERHPLHTGRHGECVISPSLFVEEFQSLTVGCTWVGCNPSFDLRFIGEMFRKRNTTSHWHYRPICVEDLTYQRLVDLGIEVPVPWKSADLFGQLPDAPAFDESAKHTAMGDARQVRDLWDCLHKPMGGTREPRVPVLPAGPARTVVTVTSNPGPGWGNKPVESRVEVTAGVA